MFDFIQICCIPFCPILSETVKNRFLFQEQKYLSLDDRRDGGFLYCMEDLGAGGDG